MKKKILFLSIVAVLLMVSMPFVSTLQAARAPATKSDTVTTVQTPTSTAPSIDSVQEATVALLQIRMSTSDPKVQALASQGIAIMVNPSPVDPCAILGVWIAGWSAGVFALAASCDGGDETACQMLPLFAGILAYVLGVYAGSGCGPFNPDSTSSTRSASYSTSTSVSGCSLCAQQ